MQSNPQKILLRVIKLKTVACLSEKCLKTVIRKTTKKRAT